MNLGLLQSSARRHQDPLHRPLPRGHRLRHPPQARLEVILAGDTDRARDNRWCALVVCQVIVTYVQRNINDYLVRCQSTVLATLATSYSLTFR